MYNIPSEANESQMEGSSLLFFVPEVITDRVISKLLVNHNFSIYELQINMLNCMCDRILTIFNKIAVNENEINHLK